MYNAFGDYHAIVGTAVHILLELLSKMDALEANYIFVLWNIAKMLCIVSTVDNVAKCYCHIAVAPYLRFTYFPIFFVIFAWEIINIRDRYWFAMVQLIMHDYIII